MCVYVTHKLDVVIVVVVQTLEFESQPPAMGNTRYHTKSKVLFRNYSVALWDGVSVVNVPLL